MNQSLIPLPLQITYTETGGYFIICKDSVSRIFNNTQIGNIEIDGIIYYYVPEYFAGYLPTGKFFTINDLAENELAINLEDFKKQIVKLLHDSIHTKLEAYQKFARESDMLYHFGKQFIHFEAVFENLVNLIFLVSETEINLLNEIIEKVEEIYQATQPKTNFTIITKGVK
jgi:hypothetical protein